jgi:hypothetical protein
MKLGPDAKRRGAEKGYRRNVRKGEKFAPQQFLLYYSLDIRQLWSQIRHTSGKFK